MTIVFLAAIGAHFSAIELPAEKKAIFTLEKSKLSKPWIECSFPLKLIFLPTLFDEAIKNNLSIGNCFFF